MKDLFTENYKTLHKDIKEKLDGGEFYYVHELENTMIPIQLSKYQSLD